MANFAKTHPLQHNSQISSSLEPITIISPVHRLSIKSFTRAPCLLIISQLWESEFSHTSPPFRRRWTQLLKVGKRVDTDTCSAVRQSISLEFQGRTNPFQLELLPRGIARLHALMRSSFVGGSACGGVELDVVIRASKMINNVRAEFVALTGLDCADLRLQGDTVCLEHGRNSINGMNVLKYVNS